MPLQILPFLVQLGPAWLCKSAAQFIPSRSFQRVKNIVDIMHQMATELFKVKKQALGEGGEAVTSQVGEGQDIMSILCS